MEATEKKKAQHYLDLPYTTAVNAEQQENGTTKFLARIVEFPECSADGATPEEAIRQIETTKAGCIERYLSDGKPVPLPLRMRKFSGKFQVRISPSLHEAIAMRAELDGISLNSYVSAALWRVVGQEEALEILIKNSPDAAGGQALRIRTKK